MANCLHLWTLQCCVDRLSMSWEYLPVLMCTFRISLTNASCLRCLLFSRMGCDQTKARIPDHITTLNDWFWVCSKVVMRNGGAAFKVLVVQTTERVPDFVYCHVYTPLFHGAPTGLRPLIYYGENWDAGVALVSPELLLPWFTSGCLHVTESTYFSSLCYVTSVFGWACKDDVVWFQQESRSLFAELGPIVVRVLLAFAVDCLCQRSRGSWQGFVKIKRILQDLGPFIITSPGYKMFGYLCSLQYSKNTFSLGYLILAMFSLGACTSIAN